MEGYENDQNQMPQELVTRNHLPRGNPISEENSFGDILQSWNFIWCFGEVLGLKSRLSLGEIAKEFTQTSPKELVNVHISFLQVLFGDLLMKARHSKQKGISEMWNISILNELTWLELARRYVLAFVSKGGNLSEAYKDIEVFRCLFCDGGRLCDSLDEIVLLEANTRLLAVAANTIYGSLNNNNDMLAIDDMDCENIVVGDDILDWAQELKEVKGIKPNVGARIKKCISKAMDKNLPTWVVNVLEIATSREVYIPNNAGKTKNIVLNLVRLSEILQETQGICRNKRRFASISDIVLKQCRIILRRQTYSLCNLLRKKFENPRLSRRITLGLRTIDMKLANGAYCGSHQAFIEDLRELWRNLPNGFEELIENFELSYNKEVVTLQQRLINHNKFELLSTDLRKNVEDILSTKIALEGLCNVCSLDEDDEQALLCDTDNCDKVYHTYCLSPPLRTVPRESWYCPCCVSGKDDDASHSASYEISALANAMQEKEYPDLSLHERIYLFNFLCDEMLRSSLILDHFKKAKAKKMSNESLLGTKFLGFDSMGRFYWALEALSSPWVVVGESNRLHQHSSTCEDSEILSAHIIENISSIDISWYCYQSNNEIQSLVDFLKDEKLLKQKVLAFLEKHKPKDQGPDSFHIQDMNEFQPPLLKLEKGGSSNVNKPMIKATRFLELKYESFVEQPTDKGENVPKEEMHRCGCLELIFPGGRHCLYCHKTFVSQKQYHGHGICDIEVTTPLTIKEFINSSANKEHYVSVEGFFEAAEKGENTLLDKVPISSKRHLTDEEAIDILKSLKANLLDIEAALSNEIVRSARACIDKRQAWRSFVKSARSIYEMVQAIIVLEDMIKPDYLDITWRQYSSSISAAANISTLAALSLKVYSLDAAIDYQGNGQKNKGSVGKRPIDTNKKMNKKMSKKMKL